MDPENKKIKPEEDFSDSTVFSKKEVTYKKSAKKGSKKTIVIMLSLALVLGIISSIIVFFTKNTPTTDVDNKTSTVEVFNFDAKNIAAFNIKNEYGILNFTSVTGKDESGSTTYSWNFNNYPSSLISDAYISSVADKVASLSAIREMSGDSSDAVYGLNSPIIIVSVTGRDGLSDYKIMVGNKSPDGSGNYTTTSLNNKVYLVAASTIESFNATPEITANNSLITPESSDTLPEQYLSNNNNLDHVDTLKISGQFFEKPISIIHTDNPLASYKVISPIERYANFDNVGNVTSILNNGLVATDCYKLLPSSADIKKYRMDKPDMIVEMSYAGKTIKLSLSKYETDDVGTNYYSLMISGKNAVYKIDADALPFIALRLNDFYNQYVFLEEISSFKNITLNDTKKSYSFDISYDEKKNLTSEKYGDKDINDTIFRTYFDYFLYLKPTLDKNAKQNGLAFSATFTYRNTAKGKIVLEIYNYNARKYIVKIDGNEVGVINYIYFDIFTQNIQKMIDGKNIPEII